MEITTENINKSFSLFSNYENGGGSGSGRADGLGTYNGNGFCHGTAVYADEFGYVDNLRTEDGKGFIYNFRNE